METLNEKYSQKPTVYDTVLHAEKVNAVNGHENLGFLSFEKGFMPRTPPLQELTAEFSAWDDAANSLPYHYHNQTLRKYLKQLPLILPTQKQLEARFLCRASVIMSMLAHAYVRCERTEDFDIPEAILVPWKEISKRLARPVPFLSYIDLIVYNWKYRNPDGPFEVENLDLLIPTVNNKEERVFYLTQTEILHKTIPVIKEIADIQAAILEDYTTGVIRGLQNIQRIIEYITEHSFLKINPNPRSSTHVDPIIWAKTVAPFAVPIKEGVQGPSGTSSPIFHLIDTLLERAKYETILGKEALFIRKWYPENWRNLLAAVEQISLSEFIRHIDNSELNGTYHSLIESYCGKQGFLGVHKKKVYGYLQLAFKVGRSVTIGGFSGIFKERTWEEVDDELERTRMERFVDKDIHCPFATLSGRRPVSSPDVQKIELSVTAQGISFRPGDRCAILPINSADVVSEVLEKMKLPEKTMIELNSRWQEHVSRHYRLQDASLTLKRVLEIGKLASINLSNLNHSILGNTECFRAIQESNITISFCDLLSILERHGVSPEIFKDGVLLTDLLEFETERMYSISSLDNGQKEKIELTVGRVPNGVASTFLHTTPPSVDKKIPLRIVKALRFKLPSEMNRPIIMFAGGTGISPFRAFWKQLQHQNKTHLGWLILCTQSRESFHYKKELEKLMLEQNFGLDVTFTKEPVKLHKVKSLEASRFAFGPGKPMGILEFLKQEEYCQKLYEYIKPAYLGGKDAVLYVSGKAGFAKAVMEGIKAVVKQGASAETHNPKEIFLELFSAGRYMQDVFTSKEETPTLQKLFPISEVVDKNNEKNGYWVIIDKKVYDLTEFKDIHPGGEKIVLDNAGRDATHEFMRAEHHLSPEIMSFMSMYCIGACIEPHFENTCVQEAYERWLQGMHLCTEMYNTLYSDYSLTDKKTTVHDTAQMISPYKAALVMENHTRFITEYIPLIIDVLDQQLVDDHHLLFQINLLKEKLCKESVLSKEKQNAACLAGLSNLKSFLTSLEDSDKKLMYGIKNQFKTGLECFEHYQTEQECLLDKNIEAVVEILLLLINDYIEKDTTTGIQTGALGVLP